jgi:PelA/Pel-15E family pectate lyase
MAGIMQLLKDINDGKEEYNYIDAERLRLLKTAFGKGIDGILKTQINDAGTPTVWCQQHNDVKLEPAWARKFEPPAICNGESVDIILL